MIRVVRGNPTPEELAAAVAVMQARASAAAGTTAAEAPRQRW
ncbi:acyl-CoA carboxylase subunit epsilon, partial [Streptomyces harbinensis]